VLINNSEIPAEANQKFEAAYQMVNWFQMVRIDKKLSAEFYIRKVISTRYLFDNEGGILQNAGKKLAGRMGFLKK